MPQLYIPASYPNLFRPDGWDAAWRAAKNAAGQVPLQVLVFGDSIAAGTNLSYAKDAWVEKLRALIGASYGNYADYSNNSQNFLGGHPWTTAQNGTAAFVSNVNYGWHTTNYSPDLTQNACQRYTTPYPCTAFDVHYLDAFQGHWSYAIDGSAPIQITNTAAASPDPAHAQVKKLSFSGLANQVHTFDWGWQSNVAAAYVHGATAYTGSPGGLALARMAVPGDAVYYFTSTQGPADRLSLYTNKNPQNDATPSGSGVYGFPMGPHLIICEMIVNDCNIEGQAQTIVPSLDTFTQQYYRLLHAARRARPGCSILFVIPCYPLATTDDCVSGFANQLRFANYVQAVYQLASAFNAAICNVNSRWGSNPATQGFMASNNLHPILPGHADMAAFIQQALL